MHFNCSIINAVFVIRTKMCERNFIIMPIFLQNMLQTTFFGVKSDDYTLLLLLELLN